MVIHIVRDVIVKRNQPRLLILLSLINQGSISHLFWAQPMIRSDENLLILYNSCAVYAPNSMQLRRPGNGYRQEEVSLSVLN